jgi:proteic killer suppression protein
MIHQVRLSKFAQKQFQKLPRHIQISLRVWVDVIEKKSIDEMRRIPGYHDEPLKGSREGQRSSRLNRAYRVIYIETNQGQLEIITVLEVNKHDY